MLSLSKLIQDMYALRNAGAMDSIPAATVTVPITSVTAKYGDVLGVEKRDTSGGIKLAFTFEEPQKGAKGDVGATPTIQKGTVTTVPYGQDANVTVDLSEDKKTATFDFTIPGGMQGPMGPAGNVTVGQILQSTGLFDVKVNNESSTPDTTVIDFYVPRKVLNGMDGKDATISVDPSVTILDSGATGSVVNTGTPNEAVLKFSLPRGPQGIQGTAGTNGTNGINGTDGISPTLAKGNIYTVENTEQADAAVRYNTSTHTGYIDLWLPKGPKGDTGDSTAVEGVSPTITLGTVSVVETEAAAKKGTTVNYNSTTHVATLNLALPKGEKGDTGAKGADGTMPEIVGGTCTVLASSATPTCWTDIQNGGSKVVLHFGIPRGQDGASGSGSGTTYTAGTGIDIAGGIISCTVTDTDTHWTGNLRVGASNTTTNAITTNGNTYLKLVENGQVRATPVKIQGSGSVSVTSDATGVITIASTSTSGDGSHYTAKPVLTTSATSVNNATTANTTTYLNVIENGTVSGSIQIKGSGGTTVSAASGVLTINSSDSAQLWTESGTVLTTKVARTVSPYSNGTSNLGTTDKMWKNGFFQHIVLGNKMLRQRQVFFTSGTFTVPAGVSTIYISGCAGGGGGSAMCGGGAGQSCFMQPFNVTAGSSVNVTVGAGGSYAGRKAVNASTTNQTLENGCTRYGDDGGNSVVDGCITLYGGQGGQFNIDSGYTAVCWGGDHGWHSQSDRDDVGLFCSNGEVGHMFYRFDDKTTYIQGGKGGDCLYGTGGTGGFSAYSHERAGCQAAGFGGGGGGGGIIMSMSTGKVQWKGQAGSGGAGIIIIEWE